MKRKDFVSKSLEAAILKSKMNTAKENLLKIICCMRFYKSHSCTKYFLQNIDEGGI